MMLTEAVEIVPVKADRKSHHCTVEEIAGLQSG
jgi:hypothetical protein